MKKVKKMMDEQNGNSYKEVETLEGLELKSTITKIKNTLERFQSRFEQAEELFQQT